MPHPVDYVHQVQKKLFIWFWTYFRNYWLNLFALLQQQQQPFYGPLSGITWVSQYQKKHSPTHHPDHHPIFVSFFHVPRSIASSLFKLRAWQSFCTTSFHVLFGLPLGLEPSTSYSMHFFTQSVSSFRSTCPCHHNLFCCSINIIGSRPSDHYFCSVCLFICLFVCAEFFSAVFDSISIKLGHMLYVWV